MDYRIPVYSDQPNSVINAMRKALGWVGGKNASQNPAPDAFSPIAAMTMPILLDPVTARLADLLGAEAQLAAGSAPLAVCVDSAIVPDDEFWWIHSCAGFFAATGAPAVQAYLMILPGATSKFATLNRSADGVRLACNSALPNNALMSPAQMPFILPPGAFLRFQFTAGTIGDTGTLQFLYLRLKLGERHP